MNLYRRTFAVLKPFWRQLVTASSSAAVHAILTGAMVWMFGPLLMTLFQVDAIDGVTDIIPQIENIQVENVDEGFFDSVIESIGSIKDNLKGWVENAVAGESRIDMLYNFCWIIFVIVLLKNLFLYLRGFYMAFVQESVVRSVRDQLFIKYQRLSLDYFHSRRTGSIISRVTNDVNVFNQSIDLSFNSLVTDTIMVLVFAATLIIISWKLTLLAMIVMPVVFGFIWYIGKKLRKYSHRTQERIADVNSVLEEAVNNTRIVKAFSMENFEINKFTKTTYRYFQSLLRMARIRHLASPINDTLATVAGIIILWFAGTQIILGTGDLDAGDFMTYLLALFQLIKPVKSLSQIHIKIQEGMAAAERIFNVIDTDEKIKDPQTPKQLDDISHQIRYDNVEFSYNESEKIINSVSFEVKQGEIVAFVGPSGGGKSTLLDLLPRFYDPQSGSISIDGINIKDVSLSDLRSLMGIVTQETYLFNDSILNNIAYGLMDADKDKVIEAAKMANAHEFVEYFPDGYDTIVGNRGVKLSGGQKQRISIARALMKDPRILIFDEATSALDTESEMLVQEAINRLMKNRTSLVIAHRLSTIKNASRILVIDQGKIAEMGAHDELLAKNGIYKRLYDMQFMEKK